MLFLLCTGYGCIYKKEKIIKRITCPSSPTPPPSPFFFSSSQAWKEAWKEYFVFPFSSSSFSKHPQPCESWTQKLFLINLIALEASWQKHREHSFSCKATVVLTQPTRCSACSTHSLRFCDKAYSCTHRRAQRDNGSGEPQIIPCPSSSQEPSAYQRPMPTSARRVPAPLSTHRPIKKGPWEHLTFWTLPYTA